MQNGTALHGGRSPLMPNGNALPSHGAGGQSSTSPGSASSPLGADLGNTLHATLSGLSLNGSSHAAPSQSSADSARPMPVRTLSSGSTGKHSAPTVQVSAIGTGRTGTSPPSRVYNSFDASAPLNGTTTPGAANSSLSPTGGGNQFEQQQQRHTPSHSLPWPGSTSAYNGGSTSLNQGGNFQHPNSVTSPYHNRTSLDGSVSPQNDASLYRQVDGHSLGRTPHDDLPDLSSHAEESASSRFSLSQQPQFNLDHAQLAKSREQRDLDDVDSGQRASATLWMGDLEGWMDESYIRRCITALGWDRDEQGVQTVQTSVKMIKGASSTSGYCFITFPTSAHANSVLSHFTKQPPMLMPGSERTFKLNWATGLPGVQPKWEGEYSIFVGDLGREVTEGELVALFTPLFPSTKSAKIMYDPSTGLSRGYGFVRFGDDKDMLRSLALGQNTSGSGLSLRGRTLRISEASGSGGSRNRTQSGELDANPPATGKNPRDLHIKVPGGGGINASLLGPNATGFSIPVASPSSPGPLSPSFGTNHSGPSTQASSPLSPASDPTNTTVFVGGLPACIGEDTLRSFFQHFGDIAYVKIPPNKGCGFVQFVRRQDAELAIAKMHDFPIHGKSRIRLSWGRSQGDKQVEHVRKLANALNVPFEAVWRMVQGQDNTTIKQIASAVGQGGNGGSHRGGRSSGPPPNANGAGHANDGTQAGLARLAGMRSSYGPGAAPNGPYGNGNTPRGPGFDAGPGMQSLPGGPVSNHIPGPHDPEAYAFRPVVPTALSPEQFGFAGPPRGGDAGPYSRVSPSAFAPMSTSTLGGQAAPSMNLAPSPNGGMYSQQTQQQHPHQQQHSSGFTGAFDPYTAVNIPSPVGGGSGIAGSSSIGAIGGQPFDMNQWRQSSRPGDMSTPSPGLPDYLMNSVNGRF